MPTSRVHIAKVESDDFDEIEVGYILEKMLVSKTVFESHSVSMPKSKTRLER